MTVCRIGCRERRCARCKDARGVEVVTVTDDSGGASVALCGRCRTLLGHERCHLCGAPKIGGAKAREVIPERAGEDGGPICDDCRDDLLFEGVSRC